MSNITQIAKRAKVSRTTVSRVLNHHSYVNAEKREAVLKAIKELNYVPNLNAINLSRGKTNVIGIIVHKINHPYFSDLIERIGKEFDKHNYSLLVHQSNNDPKKELEFFNMLKYKMIDGLILGSSVSPTSVIDELSYFGKIVSCEYSKSNKIAKVYANHESSIKMAVDHLRDQGHQEIGLCIGSPQSGVGTTRKKSFFNLQKEYHLNWRDDWYFEERYTIEDGVEVAKEIIGQPSRPTAMVVGSDHVATGIIYEAKKQGIKIPEELAIIGFGNQPISKIVELTSINPMIEAGETAANLLYSMIQNQDVPFNNTIELELIKRKST
ncbi:LacI family DNA-binding transcriptional regulator [Jeotgalibacillus marinus]|uniref:LacI family DNA-binding transcriptional regulator n=1 Tax=Jeotgalibacillus marinus TaxID=86667 RepID=A0ABV3Q6R1_9BACL